MTHPNPLGRFDGVDRVVADPLRLKLKLRIGEDAYTSLRLRKNLSNLWEVGGAAASGAGLAASQTVATTLFASSGVLSWLGIGAAASTPVGWVIAAAVVSGSTYYGVMRIVRQFSGSRVDTIPKFINTPLDLLGATLLDLIGGLAARVATIDGELNPVESEAIARHFVQEWGLDATYVDRALEVLLAEASATRVKELAKAVAEFQATNPDCNAQAMSDELMEFLRQVVEADGRIDEREELALDAVADVFRSQRQSALRKAREITGRVSSSLAAAGTTIRNVRPVRGRG